MTDDVNRLESAARALRTAAPHRLAATVREVLCGRYGAENAEFLMVDFGLKVLQPVTETTDPAQADSVEADPARAVSVHGSAAGRAFGAQQPFMLRDDDGRTWTHLPVTVRGDRLGVLCVTLPPGAPPEADLPELVELAGILGHEVSVADRDTDVYQRARRRNRLTLAAEMQWQLLPARSSVGPEYALGAQLEPAYAVFGDNFDWSVSADRLLLYVTDGMGEGIEAALLTSLGINALRNARRAGVSIADQAALADQAVYAQYGGEAYLSVLLVELDLRSGLVRVVDAGSPRILRLRDGAVTPVPLEEQLPLGMFEETDYTIQEFRLRPGDRLLFVSDGVHAVAAPGGERYGERALARALTATRLLPAADVPAAVLRELIGHRGRPEPDDDALAVCLDWFGKQPTSM